MAAAEAERPSKSKASPSKRAKLVDEEDNEAQEDSSAAETPVFDLGGRKRVEVSQFRGMTLIRIGEWYEDAKGELKPGKGISLKVEQWKALIENKDKLLSAMQHRSTAVVVQLSDMRRASVTEFKKMVLLNIREFYKDKESGEEKPGKKGAALTMEQYGQLLNAAAAIDAAIDEMG